MSDHFFGKLSDGSEVRLISLSNRHGMQVEFLNYGAAIHRIKTPDINGLLGDITLFCTNISDYQKQKAYLGATIGRFANRINNASFTLDGQNIELIANEGENQLHGGPSGFDNRIWSYSSGSNELGVWLRFTLVSGDGSQGYPGELQTQVEYVLDNNNKLRVHICAQTNKPTIVSMTNHSYFNLSGKAFSNLNSHYFQIASDQYLEIDAKGIPTGGFLSARDTALDLTQPTEISNILTPLAVELSATRGFDHTYVFANADQLKQIARVIHAESGRVLSVSSNHPSAQFYTGNYLQQCEVVGPGGARYRNHSGFCIEPQRFPDSPNHGHFPTSRLNPGDTYQHTIEYQFSTINIESAVNL